MKRILFIITCILLLTLTGCGLPQNVKNQEKESLKIAQSIPLPELGYNTNNGHKYAYGGMQCEIIGYTSDTGEPVFDITIKVHDSNFWTRTFVIFNGAYPYYNSLIITNYNWSFGNYYSSANGNSSHYTLTMLEQNKDKLKW